MHPVEVYIYQPLHHLRRQLLIQVCHKHTLLRARTVVQQRRRNPVPPPVVGYIVTDDVLHAFSSSSPKRNGRNGCRFFNAIASASTSAFKCSRKFQRAPAPSLAPSDP